MVHDTRNASITRDAGVLYDALLPTGRLLTTSGAMTQSHTIVSDAETLQSLPAVVPGIELLGPPSDLDIPECFMPAAKRFAEHYRSPRTLQTYRARWIRLVALCVAIGRCALPMAVSTAIGLICYLADGAGSLSVPSEGRTTIAFVHKLANLPDPTKDPEFLRFWSGIVNVIGTDHPNAKWAIVAEEVASMVAAALAIGTPRSFQDACILVCLYEFALRRSELENALVADLFFGKTVTLEVARSKTRSCMEAVSIDEARAPVDSRRLLERWQATLGRERGPLFPYMSPDGRFAERPLSDDTMARIVKRYAACVGINPELVGAHSMRAGWATQAILDGKSDAETAAHLRHDSLDTILEYYRPRIHRRLNLTRISLGEVV